jgi:hypothetical protein
VTVTPLDDVENPFGISATFGYLGSNGYHFGDGGASTVVMTGKHTRSVCYDLGGEGSACPFLHMSGIRSMATHQRPASACSMQKSRAR